MNRIESQDLVRSTKPHGIADYREYDRIARSFENAWGVFATVEAGDDRACAEWLATTTRDIIGLRDRADMVVVLPFAHLSNNLAPPVLSRVVLDLSVSALRRVGLVAERITFGTSKWLRWDISSAALNDSYVEYGQGHTPRPLLSGMFLKLRSLECQRDGASKLLSNIVAVACSQTADTAFQCVPDLIGRLEDLRRKRFYEATELVVIPLTLGGSSGHDPALSERIINEAEVHGWKGSDLPWCKRITLELAGQPADASYFEFP